MIATFVLMLKKSYETKNATDGGRVNSSQFGGDVVYEWPLVWWTQITIIGQFPIFSRTPMQE